MEQQTELCGLSQKEAERRALAGEANIVAQDTERTTGDILKANLLTFFNLINLLLGISLALVGSWRNMAFLGTVAVNAVIGTVQELRTRRTLSRLRLMNEAPVRVMRDGRIVSLPPAQTVKDDIIELRIGDQIPADCVVREGSAAVNESLLTGESDNIEKKPGDDLLSGSFLTSGSVTAQMVRVGSECYAAQLTKEAKAVKGNGSKLMFEMRVLIRAISIVMVPTGILLFARQYFLSGIALKKAVPTAVGAMVGMIPNGLMLLVSLALMVGVIRLGKRGVLIQELYGIEALARADVLCLDKTGTLTTGKMKAERLIAFGGCSEEEMRREFARITGAFEAQNSTSAAIAEAVSSCAEKQGAEVTFVCAEKPVSVLPFSSDKKYSAASFEDGTTLILGAPTYVYLGELPAECISETAKGNRVIALCRAEGMIRNGEAPQERTLIGLAVLTDEIRENAAATLKNFRDQGVDIRVISGDDPVTVSAIAKKLGLPGAENAADVSGLTDEQLAEAAEHITVFGRVKPDQKRKLVEALKSRDHNVAMTGDGVNDIPAMKASDCSIAMASGSDATRHAAMVTLLDSDFASMPAVVAEGRRVVNNVTRAASLFLMKTLYSLCLTLVLVIIPLSYPFQPVQLTLISALTIGLPSFILAMEPNAEPIRGHFLRTVVKRSLPCAAGVALGACMAMLLEHFGIENEICSVIAALCASCAGILMLHSVCLPLTRLRSAVLFGMAVLLIGAIIIAGRFFYIDLGLLSASHLAITAGAVAVCAVCMAAIKKFLKNNDLEIMARLGL